MSNDGDKGWITQGIRKSCQRKRSLYIISKNSGNLMIILYYKSYCSILKRVIRETKRVYFKHLIETSENKTKAMWNIINELTRKAEKSGHLPRSFKMNNKKVSIFKMNNKKVSLVNPADAFNNDTDLQ